MTALVLASIFGGALLQRVSGLGFAMVVAPFLVMALGAEQGVVLVNLCGLVAAGLVLLRVLRDVDWHAVAALLPLSLLGIGAGSWLLTMLPPVQTQVVTACVLLVAMAAVTFLPSAEFRRSPALLAGTGAAAGVMGVTAGVGGVPLVVAGRLTQWEQKSFAATLQPYFVILSAVTVAVRVATAPQTWPPLAWPVWLGIAAALLGGLALGEVVSRRLSADAVRGWVLTIAWAGTLLSLALALVALRH